MKIPESTKEKLLLGLIAGATGILGAAISAVLKSVALPFVQEVVPVLDNSKLLWLCLLSLLANLALSVWVAYLMFFDKKLTSKYEFLKDRAFYKQKQTGDFFCPNCILKGLESPLTKNFYTFGHDKNPSPVWTCLNIDCKSHYPRKLPEEK